VSNCYYSRPWTYWYWWRWINITLGTVCSLVLASVFLIIVTIERIFLILWKEEQYIHYLFLSIVNIWSYGKKSNIFIFYFWVIVNIEVIKELWIYYSPIPILTLDVLSFMLKKERKLNLNQNLGITKWFDF
jgi:hypothetical protein